MRAKTASIIRTPPREWITIPSASMARRRISTMKDMRRIVDNGFVYNLSGQRVDASYKGLVIKNGQKLIQK